MRAVLDCSRLGMKMKEIKACQQVFTAAGHRPRAFFEKNPDSDSMVPKSEQRTFTFRTFETPHSTFPVSDFHSPLMAYNLV